MSRLTDIPNGTQTIFIDESLTMVYALRMDIYEVCAVLCVGIAAARNYRLMVAQSIAPRSRAYHRNWSAQPLRDHYRSINIVYTS